LSQGSIIIEVSSIKMSRTREVYFAGIGTQARRRFESRFRQQHARGRVIEPKKIKFVMNPGKLTIRLEKGWVMLNSLVKQIDSSQQIPSVNGVVVPRQNEVLAAAVKVEGSEISSLRALDSESFSGRNFGVKLVRDLLCNLGLDRKNVL